ncbi:MAG: hypothetical protein DIU61_009530 [Bacteroidota bacterium]|jgi:hypothetical protein|nr:MAG: hypothetical protein DIU61_04110 [Bacteroidota bacterium]
MLKFFRNQITQRATTLLTGFVFLNMSFFMIELTALKLGKYDKEMFQDLVTMLARVSEEEKGAQSSAPSDSGMAKEVDLYMHQYTSELSAGYTLITTSPFAHHQANPSAGMHDTPLQPPEA